MKCLFLIFFAYTNLLFSQNFRTANADARNIPKQTKNFLLTNSAGINLDKSKPTLYLNFLRRINEKFFAGLKVGTYNSKEDIDSLMYKFFFDESILQNPGFYTGIAKNVPVEGNPFIIGAQGLYNFNKIFSITATIGMKGIPIKYYKQVEAEFVNPGGGAKISFGYSLGKDVEKKTIIKSYYSIGVDYNFDSYQLGLFADNIFSIGLNAGIFF